jgi:hypothetical protein
MRHAIVIIHGIGEQRPMQTLRGFVDAVLPDVGEGDVKFWSAPDELSELFELRVLKTIHRPRTDFFEFYWAHHVQGTKFIHLARWLMTLLFRRPREVPDQLRALWWTSWTSLVIFVISILFGFANRALSAADASLDKAQLWLLSAVISAVVQLFCLHYLGDAARYLSAHPKNVAIRQKIRSSGVNLLKALHERGYDRIIVVGHSLGSVIGYDILCHLWHEYHDKLAAIEKQDPSLVKMFAEGKPLQPVISQELPEVGERLGKQLNENMLKKFQISQQRARAEQQELGNPWRISDFITLGSPLAHSAILLASDRMSFDRLKRQKELPTCPPQSDIKGYGYAAKKPMRLGQKFFTPLLLHHGAPFAVTSWTNIFYRTRFGIFGDVIGGPLAGWFGLGIRDICIHGSKDFGLLGNLPFVHTKYWAKIGHNKQCRSLTALIKALRLSDR